jgi:hypothetical protein
LQEGFFPEGFEVGERFGRRGRVCFCTSAP